MVLKEAYSSLPNLIVIGAMKAGTSSLHQYLSQHPDIQTSALKELNFFNTSLNWNKGLDWYADKFDSKFKIRCDISPNYSKWSGTAERIQGIIPDAKIIYLLRNPIKRFESQCNHVQKDPNALVENIKEGVKNEIYSNGLYGKWYEEYLRHFPKEQILLIKNEDFQARQKETLLSIFDFLNLDANAFNFDNPQLSERRNVSEIKMRATSNVQDLNQNKGFRTLKERLGFLKPLLRPLWTRLYYKNSVMQYLNEKNAMTLKQLYLADAEMLEKLTGDQFYVSQLK